MAAKYHGMAAHYAMLRTRVQPDKPRMTRRLLPAVLAIALTLGFASPARADITAFWGFAPKPDTHGTRGFSLGISMLIVAFEGEYSALAENVAKGAPGLRTGMINGILQTPTNTQIYLTMGGGFYREELGSAQETQIGTNVGGGIKIGLVGPLRLRVDYRIFNLRGSPVYRNPQRIYVGANLKF